MTRVLFPGSFDPIHFGHMDVVRRLSHLFSEVVVGLGMNSDKKPIFSLEERADMATQALSDVPNATVIPYRILTVNHAYLQNIPLIVKGVRAAKDFDYERELNEVGESQEKRVETFLMFSRPEHSSTSSSAAKALQANEGLIDKYVPLYVKQRLEARMSGSYILGVTGEIGSGKSYVCTKFEEFGRDSKIPVYNIDLDMIGHTILTTTQQPVYREVQQQVAATFGAHVQLPDGTINRKPLGEIVFSDPDKLAKLNEIMKTPLMTGLQLALSGKRGLVLFDAALIAESDMAYLCNNNVLLLDVNDASQQRRLVQRALSPEQIQRRLGSQYNPDEKQRRLAGAIQRDSNGRLWQYDDSDGADEAELRRLFDNIVLSLDIYGELRFRAMWARIGANATPDADYKKLIEIYMQPHRFYHTWTHIMQGLNELEDVKQFLDEPEQFMFAWMIHDAVMEPMSRVDEERSAALAYTMAKNALLPDHFCDGVRSLIIASKHNEIPTTNDARYFADLDLAIFGKPPEEFDEYERKIRMEYAWAPEDEFRSRRADILQRFLDRPSIYYTEICRDKYEAQARSNLERSIAGLRGN